MADKKKPPPPYDGEELSMCLPQPFDFAHTTAVVVSGDRWNPCGHMLLKVGESVPYYFHVAGPYMGPTICRNSASAATCVRTASEYSRNAQ